MGRSRGQVILIAALGIAVTLVALALITNTAIYTENLATRSTVNGQDAIAFHQSMEEGATGLLSLANRYNASSHSSIQSQYEADIANLSASTEIESVVHGDLATVSLVDTTNGARISQNETGNFTDVNGSDTWTFATGVEQTRRFEMNVTPNDSLSVIANNDTEAWQVDITNDGSAVDVTFQNDTDSTTCTVSGDSVEVDLTEGTVGGEACEGSTFASDLNGAYNISFQNASSAEGRFVLFVDRTPGQIDEDQYPPSMSVDPAIYDATIHLSLEQPDLTYETNVTVAPESSPEGAVYGTVP